MNRQSNRITFSVLTGILLLSTVIVLLIAYQIGMVSTPAESNLAASIAVLR
jgi:uncharacterized membrane protein (DUF485 family)